jgi:hypothetical protein
MAHGDLQLSRFEGCDYTEPVFHEACCPNFKKRDGNKEAEPIVARLFLYYKEACAAFDKAKDNLKAQVVSIWTQTRAMSVADSNMERTSLEKFKKTVTTSVETIHLSYAE